MKYTHLGISIIKERNRKLPNAPFFTFKMINATTIASVIVASGIAYIAWKLFKQNKELTSQLKQSQSKIKSLFVLHGHSVEKLAPFSSKFGGDMKEITFLGNPLDYIGFHKDKVVFYEIKSGQSQLSNKQKAIRRLIDEKRIEFKEVRLT